MMTSLKHVFDRSSDQYKATVADIKALAKGLSEEQTLESANVIHLLEKIGEVKVVDIAKPLARVLQHSQIDVMKAIAAKMIAQSKAHTGQGSDAGDLVADMLAAASVLHKVPEADLSDTGSGEIRLAKVVAAELETYALDFVERQSLRFTPNSFARLANYGYDSEHELFSRYFVKLSQIFQDKMVELSKTQPTKEYNAKLANAYRGISKAFDAQYTGYSTVELAVAADELTRKFMPDAAQQDRELVVN